MAVEPSWASRECIVLIIETIHLFLNDHIYRENQQVISNIEAAASNAVAAPAAVAAAAAAPAAAAAAAGAEAVQGDSGAVVLSYIVYTL